VTDSNESPATRPTYVAYSDDLEQRRPDEDKLIKKIIKSLHRNNEWAFKKYKHAIRDAHAKSHGILRGELTVSADLPDHLRQGLFATPATYPVIARFSTTAGAIRSDQIRGVRGLALKVLGVHGPRALPEFPEPTQDFVFVNRSEFPFADVHAYRWQGMLVARLLARTPDTLVKLGSGIMRGIGKVGLPLPPFAKLLTEPNHHPLGQTYHSAAPLRYGEYVAKISIQPSESVKRLVDQPAPRNTGYDADREMVVNFFRSNNAQYEVRAQLCTDPASMPIEDASVPWSESASPRLVVATINFPTQNADSPKRRAFGDDVLSFNSWRSLADHRPLGSINRLKKDVYEASSDFRHKMNKVERIEPTDIAELPD